MTGVDQAGQVQVMQDWIAHGWMAEDQTAKDWMAHDWMVQDWMAQDCLTQGWMVLDQLSGTGWCRTRWLLGTGDGGFIQGTAGLEVR